MKRTLLSFCLLLALLLSMALPTYAASTDEFLYDEADLLSQQEEAALAERLSQISSTYNAQVVIVTLNDMGGAGIDTYVEFLYDTMDFGYGANRDGVLLLISMDVREFRILTNGFAADAITLNDIDSISDGIVSDLSAGDYASAFDLFASDCRFYLDGYINGFSFPVGSSLLISLLIGFVIALIVTLVMKGQLKSVHRQSRASSYIKSGSMQLTTSRDLFLYRDVKRIKKETNNNNQNRSSGSSRNVGGRSF